MAIWQRHGGLEGLVHHSDRGSQYLSIRYTERLAEAGAVTSVGSRGDSFDNALAETIIGLYKAELIRRRGPWRGLDEVEYATLEWVDWFNHRRLLEPIGHIPPAEFEATYRHRKDPSRTIGLKDPYGLPPVWWSRVVGFCATQPERRVAWDNAGTTGVPPQGPGPGRGRPADRRRR
jgi:hypothetical protein